MKRLLWYLGCVPILILSAAVSFVCLLSVVIGIGALYLLFGMAWHVWQALEWFSEWSRGPSVDPMGGKP